MGRAKAWKSFDAKKIIFHRKLKIGVGELCYLRQCPFSGINHRLSSKIYFFTILLKIISWHARKQVCMRSDDRPSPLCLPWHR